MLTMQVPSCHVAVVLQRRDGTVGHREVRTDAQRRAGGRLVHREDRLDEVRLADLVLYVLARVADGELGEFDRQHVGVDVAGLGRRPDGVDLRERIAQFDKGLEVGGSAFAAVPGEVVVHIGLDAVGGRVQGPFAKHAIVLRPAAGEQDLRRHRLEAGLDDLPCELRRERLPVDLRPGGRKQVDRLRSVVRDADLLEDLERLFVEEVLLALRQIGRSRPGHGASFVAGRQGTTGPARDGLVRRRTARFGA
jgi:hypothetical protein